MARTGVKGSSQLGARHQPSGLNCEFNGSRLTFAQYVERNRAMLGRAHAGNAERQKIIDGNAPFELLPEGCPAGRHKPWRRGVLLVHGLSDSPYTMRHLGHFFQQQGFRVMAVLLPGHGTQPGDLLEVRWQEWGKTVAYGAYQLAGEVEELYLAGYSTGATLSIFHALRDREVRGLFLFSPALRISRWAALANWHKLYSWLMPAAQWLHIMPDRDIYKYESLAKNAVGQVYALTKVVAGQLRRRGLDIPVFAAASADDTTVQVDATLEFIAQARHPDCKLVLYTASPERFAASVRAERLVPVNSAYPERGILSSAHTAIVMPPEDEHYGITGDYVNCLHYYPADMPKYAACLKHAGQIKQGELTRENLQGGLLCRLTYNPDFAGLKVAMQRFIASLEQKD